MRKEPLYKRYATAAPVGVVALSNCFGLLVFEPLEEDRPDTEYITAWSGSEGQRWTFSRNKVHYTTSGRPFLIKGSQRFYFDEIMRA